MLHPIQSNLYHEPPAVASPDENDDNETNKEDAPARRGCVV